MTTLQFVQGLLDWLLADPSHIVAAAAATAAVTPTPDPASTWGKAYKVLEIFALNVLHAKEGGPMPAPSPAAVPQRPTGGVVAPLIAAILLFGGLGPLAGCAHQSPADQVFELRAGYDAAVLVPVTRYHALAECSATVPAPCRDAEVDARLIKADGAAKAALDGAEDVVRNHPQMDAAAATAAAQDAVDAVRAILTTYNIK